MAARFEHQGAPKVVMIPMRVASLFEKGRSDLSVVETFGAGLAWR
jgi:hypothetical protein